MNWNRRPILYTDLDGTLLDAATYSFADAQPGLRAAQARGIPIVFCSSKTRAEIEIIRRQTGVSAPFIVENGGAIVVPANYFPIKLSGSLSLDGYQVIELGVPYDSLVAALRLLRPGLPVRIVGFSDLTSEEVAAECNLSLADAIRAQAREYDEPFRVIGPAVEHTGAVLRSIAQNGLRCSAGGRFYHLHGNNDKGRAVTLLTALFTQALGEVVTIALGDSANDLPMLAAVDWPVLVQKPDGTYDRQILMALPQVHLARGIGPVGWRKAVTDLLAALTL